MDENAAENNLLANMLMMESYEVRARAGALKTGIFPPSIIDVLSKNLAEDAVHLRYCMSGVAGKFDEDLTHALDAALCEKNPLVTELGHVLIVEPALKALAELLHHSKVKRQKLFKTLAVEEKNHYSLSAQLSETFKQVEEPFTNYAETNLLLMYVTVFPSDEGKTMLLTLLGPGHENSLKLFYQTVDKLRYEAVSTVFGPNSEAAKLVKGYGLAKTGMC